MWGKQKRSSPEQQDWFRFSSGLMHGLCSDYIALRLLLYVEPWTTAQTILVKMIEVAEKSLKLYIAVNDQSTNASDRAKKSSHNIEQLRQLSATHDESFNDVGIRDFTRDLSDKSGELFQFLRYGSHDTTFGFSTDFSKLAPVVDKIFLYSLLKLPEPHRKMLVFCSALKQLITGSRFDQSRNRQLLLKALQNGNPCFDDFISYCHHLDVEHEKLTVQIQQQQ